MPGAYPSPFGKTGEDVGHTANQPDPNGAQAVVVVPRPQPADPRVLAVKAPGPCRYDFGGHEAAEARRLAKGQAPHARGEVHRDVWGRPKGKRNPPPTAGQRVGFVRVPWGDPEPATVLDVQPLTDNDPNLNGLVRDEDGVVYDASQDPMPWVLVQTDDGLVTTCREARARGSAGWLPLPKGMS